MVIWISFLLACAVALFYSHRIREGFCAALSLAGVALLSLGPWGYFDLLGYMAALGAAAAFGLYTVFADKVGKAGSGLDGLALSVTVAAMVSLPFASPQIGKLDLPGFGVLVLSALVGVVIPYAVDTIAARVTSARVVGTLFATDPAMGALAGLVFLGQTITVTAVVGIAVVASAGALLIWTTDSQGRVSSGA
ncbi:EamA family transporter [Microbacterium oleivorans]|uniref:EamA family transporter n=1 Tax=Microbacterium oleivorans TaxID=273677 RepID=UPI0021172305|nr:EamA family transporter [Microbacterium oleivorans]